MLLNASGKRLPRKKCCDLCFDDRLVAKWRFGIAPSVFRTQLADLRQNSWHPEDVYVECFTTFWWEGAKEAIETVKDVFPEARCSLIGAYACLEPEHARQNTKVDSVISRGWSEVSSLPAHLDIYPSIPPFLFVALGNERSAKEVVQEIEQASARGVRRFAFADHLTDENLGLFRKVLKKLAKKPWNAKFSALGTVHPHVVAVHPKLPCLMRKVGFEQVVFADDRETVLHKDAQDQLLDDYRIAVDAFRAAGFPDRTDSLCGSVCVGYPGEDVHQRARMLTHVAHIVGSVIPWPYQPSRTMCPDLALEDVNGKHFPLRALNNASYTDYLNLLSLATVLNSKYREHTFDFLGEGLIATLFRHSLARQGWEADGVVKGEFVRLPMKMAS